MSNDDIFAAAYREHYWAVSRYVARRLQGRTGEVEEVVAEVFTVAWRRRGDLPDAPLPWLYGVARNCLANAVRGYGRRRRLVDRLGNDQAAHSRHIVDSPDAEAPGAWVHEALDRLSPADQEVLRLAAWEELDTEEIAVALGCGRRAAAMRLHRARRRLRAEIDRGGPVAPSADSPPQRRAGPAESSNGPLPGRHTRPAVPAGDSLPEQWPGDAGRLPDPARSGGPATAEADGPGLRSPYSAPPVDACPYKDPRHA